MKLVIISNMAHHQGPAGIVGWGPTVREIDHLAALFDEVVHLACVHPGPPPESALPYRADNVRCVLVPPAGGAGLGAKLDIVRLVPRYLRTIRAAMRSADVVHVRCPANIPLLALVLLALTPRRSARWVKYAGSWERYPGEPLSFRLQRWMLRRGMARGSVTVNGRWPGQPGHVHSFENPCLEDDELGRAAREGGVKRFTPPLRLLFVGQAVRTKGIFTVLETARLLHQAGLEFVVDFVGDGADRQELQARVAAAGLEARVRVHGWRSRDELPAFYRDAHFVLLPSRAEGWPKVLSEAMAHGAVPLASTVSSIPQYLAEFRVGATFGWNDAPSFAREVLAYAAHPERWRAESQRGITAAARFTYAAYTRRVQQLLDAESPAA